MVFNRLSFLLYWAVVCAFISPTSVNGNFIKDGYRAISQFYGSLRPDQVSSSIEKENNVKISDGPSKLETENVTRRHISSFVKLKPQSPNATTDSLHKEFNTLHKILSGRTIGGLTAIGQEIMNYLRPYIIVSLLIFIK
jgi:hypothetical protein